MADSGVPFYYGGEMGSLTPVAVLLHVLTIVGVLLVAVGVNGIFDHFEGSDPVLIVVGSVMAVMSRQFLNESGGRRER